MVAVSVAALPAASVSVTGNPALEVAVTCTGPLANFSGKFYQVTHYGVAEGTERIDYDALQKLAEEVKPKMITAGASAYPRTIDFARMAEAIERRSRYLRDFAHAVSHEFKTPLSGIRGAAQLLEQSVTPDELPLARLIRDEVDRITDLGQIGHAG